MEEIVSEQTKLACTTGFLKANLQPLASPDHEFKSLSTGITLSHGDWADYNAEMNVALPQTTEPNRKFCSVGRRSNRTFGWIFGKLRHFFSTLAPAAARFRRSFRNSVCKTSLLVSFGRLRFSIWLFCCVSLTTSTHDIIDVKFSGVKEFTET